MLSYFLDFQGFYGAWCRRYRLLYKSVEQLPPMGGQLSVETEGMASFSSRKQKQYLDNIPLLIEDV